MRESPVFIKCYEMMVWLLGRTAKFPKNQRFLLARRMEDCALDLYEDLATAARTNGAKATAALEAADCTLGKLKVHNRLSKDLGLLAFNQYEYLAKALDEVGRLLGAWRKRQSRGSPAAEAE